MYHKTSRDFLDLGFMNKNELKQAISKATAEYMEVQQYVQQIEENLAEMWASREITYFEYKAMLPKVEPYIKNLHNIECYIRKADKLLNAKGNKSVTKTRSEIKPQQKVEFKPKKKAKSIIHL